MAAVNLVAFAAREDAFAAAATAIAEALREGIGARGRGVAALSGGSTPAPAYAKLAEMELDWPRVDFALVDERCVPIEHPSSNEALLRRTLAPALAKGARLWPMFPHDGANADAYRGLGALDIALMGMGEDGHTASWFPGAEGLAQALDPACVDTVVAIEAPRAAGAAQRLTLSYAAIARARRVLLLITGDKRAVLERADAEGAPVARLFALGERLGVFWAP